MRILFNEGEFSYVSKIDESKAWIKNDSITFNSKIINFVRPKRQQVPAHDFLNEYKGVPYLWGGITKAGIDCSGFTQEYFLCVHDTIIPRNSREQRQLSEERSIDQVKQNDLVFCRGKVAGGHHVGLYLDSKIWHSYSIEGVVCHSIEKFSEIFNIECVVSVDSKVYSEF